MTPDCDHPRVYLRLPAPGGAGPESQSAAQPARLAGAVGTATSAGSLQQLPQEPAYRPGLIAPVSQAQSQLQPAHPAPHHPRQHSNSER